MTSAHTARTARVSLYSIVLLVLIVVLGFVLRAWRLDQAPRGALIDELHFGYIAHSIAETGRDEHGMAFPVIFTGFGDQKLPAYAYLLVPVIRLLGLTVTAIRIPSLIAGTLLIAVMYAFARELELGRRWALFAAFVTAVIPWSFFLSRIGFESNIGLLFFAAGLTAALRGFRTHQLSWQLVSAFSLGLTWYSYIAYRPVVVMVLAALLWVYRQSKLRTAIIGIIFVLTVVPLLLPSVIGANATRFNQVGIVHDPGLALEINENRTFCSMTLPTALCYGVFNKPMLITQKLVAREFRTFSPQYLATEGEDETFLTVERFGQLYSVLYPFFLLGLGALIFTPILPRAHRKLLLIGLLVSPLPGLLAGEPQKVRLSPLLPFVIITTVAGAATVASFLQKNTTRLRQLVTPICILLLVGALLWQTTDYITAYAGVHSLKRESEYQSYLPDLYRFIKTLPEDSLVVIKPFYSDPLMFYAFYTGVEPRWYQENAVLGALETSGFQHTVELGRVWAYDYSIDTVSCKARERGLHGYLVTNEELPFNPVYQGISSNGVHRYVQVYDAESAQADCLETPETVLR